MVFARDRKYCFLLRGKSYSARACTRTRTHRRARARALSTHKLSFNLQIAWKTKSFVVNDQMARQVVELDPLTGRTIALTRTPPLSFLYSSSLTPSLLFLFATSHLSGSKFWNSHGFMCFSCKERTEGE